MTNLHDTNVSEQTLPLSAACVHPSEVQLATVKSNFVISGTATPAEISEIIKNQGQEIRLDLDEISLLILQCQQDSLYNAFFYLRKNFNCCDFDDVPLFIRYTYYDGEKVLEMIRELLLQHIEGTFYEAEIEYSAAKDMLAD